jgi:hypothetical protein
LSVRPKCNNYRKKLRDSEKNRIFPESNHPQFYPKNKYFRERNAIYEPDMTRNADCPQYYPKNKYLCGQNVKMIVHGKEHKNTKLDIGFAQKRTKHLFH